MSGAERAADRLREHRKIWDGAPKNKMGVTRQVQRHIDRRYHKPNPRLQKPAPVFALSREKKPIRWGWRLLGRTKMVDGKRCRLHATRGWKRD